MAERSPKTPDSLDEPIDVLQKPSGGDELDSWGEDVLDSDGSPLDEPNPRVGPEPLPAVSPEPAGSDLSELQPAAEPAAEWAEEPEPVGDDLSWADTVEQEQNLPASWPETPPSGEETPLGDDWPEEHPADDSLWIGLEDERLLSIGSEEWATLEELGLQSVRARASTLHRQTVLRTPRESLAALGEAETLVRLGPIAVSVVLSVVLSESEELLIGQDILAGRFLVDVRRRELLGTRAEELG